MAARFTCRISFLIALAMLLPYEANAQGFFDKVSIPKTVIATGQTETLGMIELTLRQNNTASDTLTIDVSPLQVTNKSAADIRITTLGAITLGATTIIADQGQVKIPVNAGAASGSIIIEGIRVAVAGTGATAVTAKLSWDRGQNYFTSGAPSSLTNSVSLPVVNAVQSGMTVDPVTSSFVVYNNQVVRNTATVVVHEGYAGAWVNSTDFGQDTPTQVQLRVSDIPVGLTLHFPASVTANETGNTLTTGGGIPVDVTGDTPSLAGNSTVVYSYTGSTPSSVPQSFNIPFTVSVTETVGTTLPTIEASLYPIGAAVPTATLPATNVTRFAANYLLALPGTSKIVTQTLYWTGIDNNKDNRLSVFNPTSGSTNLTLTALDATGHALGSSPVQQSLASNHGLESTLADLFGSGLAIATVQIQSTASGILALGTSTGSGVSGSIAVSQQPVLGFMLPSFGDNASLSFFNPQSVATSGKVTLLSVQGTPLASGTVTLPSMSSTTVSAQQLFGTTATGQIAAQFVNPVVMSETSIVGNGVNYVQPQIPYEVTSWYVPFIASGGGYETDLSLINPSAQQTLSLRAQLFDNQGNPQGSAQQVALAPGAQLLTTVSQLFNLSTATAGYVQIQVSAVMQWVLSYYPGLIGYARVHVGSIASTTFPLTAYAVSTSYELNTAGSGQYQGLAVLNPNGSVATVTVQAIDSNGTALATATVSLKPGQFSTKLLSELFGAAVPEHSILRVSSSEPVVSISLSGSNSLSSLRAIPVLW
jgi:hypothetical protein